MKLLVVSVWDEKVGTFSQPVLMRSKGEAIRSFGMSAQKEESWRLHPGDYTLFALAEFDDNTGQFVNARERLIGAGELG